jgi:hypothetical protein
VPTAPSSENQLPGATVTTPLPTIEPQATAVANEIDPPAATAGPESESTSGSSQGYFFNLYFMLTADSVPVSHYANGTEEVFAFWEYAAMTSDDIVRRVWYRNGAEWLVREDAWDVVQFGSAGRMNTVSVYDFTGSGLAAGSYELVLYINNIYQVSGNFIIREDELTVRHGAQRAWVEDETTLLWQDENGATPELLPADDPIVELLWHPAGSQLFFVTELPPEPDGPPWPSHVAWQFDIASRSLTALNTLSQDINRLRISPDGRYLSALSGNDFGDACFMNRALMFMDLANVTVWLDIATFGTDLIDQPYQFFPADAGQWTSDETFAVNMTAYCLGPEISPAEDLQLLGRYQFDLGRLSVSRASE